NCGQSSGAFALTASKARLKAENDAIDATRSWRDTGTATEAGFVWRKESGALQIVTITGNPVGGSPRLPNEPESGFIRGIGVMRGLLPKWAFFGMEDQVS